MKDKTNTAAPAALTAAELALYLGQECEGQNDVTDGPTTIRFKGHRFPINGVILDTVAKGRVQFKPLLRPMSSLTEDEARECYRIWTGNEWPEQPADWHNRYAPSFPFTCLNVWFNGYYGTKYDEEDFFLSAVGKCAVSPPRVDDYLRSIGIDTRGWIADGRALDKTKIETT